VKEDENLVYGMAILGGVGDLNGKSVREAAKHPLVSGTWKYCTFLSGGTSIRLRGFA